jgi:hypothetical protein
MQLGEQIECAGRELRTGPRARQGQGEATLAGREAHDVGAAAAHRILGDLDRPNRDRARQLDGDVEQQRIGLAVEREHGDRADPVGVRDRAPAELADDVALDRLAGQHDDGAGGDRGEPEWHPEIVAAAPGSATVTSMRASIVVLGCLLACGGRPTAPPPPKPVVVTPDKSGPALPAGVLARATGTQGVIEVIERDGVRQLVIGGVVHAAVATGAAANDPLVEILRRVRPDAKSALVIGLGSGRTADQLSAAGLDVLAVELEPEVVRLARELFGYRGKAEVADGLTFLERDKRQWDLVVIDALSATGLPEAFLEPSAIDNARRRLTGAAGVLAVRMVEKPGSDAAHAFLRRQGEHRHHLALGSGIGDEQQNLYLLDGERPISFDADAALPVWPLTVPGRTAQRVPTSRDVTLLGYLVRVGPEKTLCLDLLHWEMGAVRFVLGGKLVAELSALVPTGESPSSGDIGSDGDTSKTLHRALGGADFKRSDVRYSPTVVVLRGKASFRTAIDADDLDRMRGEKGAKKNPPLLEWGGVLYDLDASELAWKFRFTDWQALHKKSLAPMVRQLHAAARRGDLVGMRKPAGAYLKALEGALGEWAPKFEVHRSMHALFMDLYGVDPKDQKSSCERVAENLNNSGKGYWVNPDLRPVAKSLFKCAGISTD